MTPIEKAERLHKRVNTFFLSCVGSDGYPLTKAVVPGKYRQSLREMYFCTNTSSKFVSEVRKNPKSNVYFYSRMLIWWKAIVDKDRALWYGSSSLSRSYVEGIDEKA